MKATWFLYFDLNSKVIVANMLTQVANETNYISLAFGLMVSRELNFCFLSILLQTKRKRTY